MDYREALKVFGLRWDPTAGQIQSLYRKLAKRHHPDKRRGDKERMQRINAAYEVLKRRHGGAGS